MTRYSLKVACSHCGHYGRIDDVTLVCHCGHVHEITDAEVRQRDADIALWKTATIVHPTGYSV